MKELEVSRRERKKEATRRRIFKVAVKLFRDRGFEATTIDEITEKADVAKGTFFNYFPRKEAVLGYLSEVWIAEAEENAEAILTAKKSAREKLVELLSGLAAQYEEDRDLSWFVIMEWLKRAFTGTEDVHARWHTLIVRVVEQGQATGELKRSVNPHRAEFVLGSVYMGTLIMWLCCPEGQFPLRDELRARLALVLDGLAD